jgi:hypothetical protein
VGVAEVVQPDDGHASAAGDAFEGLGEGVGVDRSAYRVGEHPARVVDADGCVLGGLKRPPAGQHGDGGWVEIDGAPGLVGLTSGFVQLVADGDESTVDRQGGLVAVDVGPAQTEQFAAAQPGHRRQPERREQAVTDRGVQEQLQVVGGPGLRFHLADRPQSGCMGDQRHVAGEDASAHGVAEVARARDDQVHFVDGLGCQWAMTVARVQHPVVQGLELLGTQATQAGAAQRGKDVAFGLVHVAAVGARRQRQPLAGQPLFGEVGTEGERPHLIVASVERRRKLCGECFCREPVAASGVPRSPLPAGDRVETLVDDGVPAVTLACHVSLHSHSPSVPPDRGSIRWNVR